MFDLSERFIPEFTPPATPPATAAGPTVNTLAQATEPTTRPYAKGKFLYVGCRKFYLRGVTYGPFRPNDEECEYHTPSVVERDFQQMAAAGFNAVRTYTPPPRWLLDIAQRYRLWVMIGLPWEQHITFLDDKARVSSIQARVAEGVRACAGHPAILAYAVGNEIPSTIVRWYGPRRVERFLHSLYRVVKAEDPNVLVTYVNYPTTEYLRLGFLDFISFNVYLESEERLSAYLARLQNLAGDKPLVMAEIGLDSQRNGETAQAEALGWQIRTVFAGGAAGSFIFAWTDEWHRGGHDIEDWDFGLTTRERSPKPALTAMQDAYNNVPFPADIAWPRVSVIVCSYNGARTIDECCRGLNGLDYPNYEVIIVDDGSTNEMATIAAPYGFQMIHTANQGLSNARNTGLAAATGEIVAYIDDDAYPDPHWLTYLAATFMETDYVGVGGPNLSPPNDGSIADCIGNAPGNPTHILLSDREAEHIPGCNMAFRKDALTAVGGFDAQFRIAGDDVDVCWQLQAAGGKLGFHPGAMVWHHRRNSVRTFWRQQINYGKAEALLEAKWPEKYNLAGHLEWHGRLYGSGKTAGPLFGKARIYHGVWGTNLFQPAYDPTPSWIEAVAMSPEWYLVLGVLALLSSFSLLWSPLFFAVPFLLIALSMIIIQGVRGARQAHFVSSSVSPVTGGLKYLLTAILHILQPLARLKGRLGMGLTPWRRRVAAFQLFVRPHISTGWSEQWQSPEDRLGTIETVLQREGAVVRRGGTYDQWDLEAWGGLLGAARMCMTIEEHGAGKQLIRLRAWPRLSPLGVLLTGLFGWLAIAALFDQAWTAALLLGAMALLFVLRIVLDCGAVAGLHVLDQVE